MSEPQQPTLSNMPAPALDVVMREVDLKTVQTVRKVCFNLRNHADSIQLDAKIVKAYIYAASSEKISLELKTANDLFEITYKKNGNDVVVDHGGYRKIENQGVGVCAGIDLGTILKNQKSTLKEVSFMFSGNCDAAVIENFMVNLSEHLETRNSKLAVKFFSWTGAIDQDQILKMLEKLDPTVINKIDLTNDRDHGVTPPPVYNIDRIVETAQWKSANEVETLGFVAQTAMSNFFKFRKAHFSIENADVDGFITIRQNALQNPKFQEIAVAYNNFSDESEFLNRFGIQHDAYKKFKNWFYKFPMNENVLTVRWRKNRVRFLRVEPKNFDKFEIPRHKVMEL